jgi:hypothetical protein
LSDAKILKIFAPDPSVCHICSGTPIYRDEQLAEELDSPSNCDKLLDSEWHAALISPQRLCPHYSYFIVLRGTMMHVHNGCEMWQWQPVARRLCLISSCKGIKDPYVRAESRSDTLVSVADVFHKSLRKEDRIRVQDALVSKAMPYKVFSPSQKQALKGDKMPSWLFK